MSGSTDHRAPALTLILCSRNDQYMGNSLWRLETALNYLGQIVQELGREKQVEALVADWASERPLEDVLRLSTDAARITRFLAIPPGVACAVQGDSDFPEVLALNAAARRARGEYIGRIDQDTLVGKRFFELFFELYEGRRELHVPLRNALLFSSRRGIPYRFAVRCPPLKDVQRLISLYGKLLPVQAAPGRPGWTSVVGIWLVHRQLWAECGGYDERMIYLNDMEQNMVARLMQRHDIVDLGEHADCAFFHLEHRHPWDSRKAARNRKVNDRSFKTPGAFLANGGNWGLQQYPLTVNDARPALAESGQRSAGGRGGEWLVFIGTTSVDGLRIAVDMFMRSPPGRWLFQTHLLWWSRIGKFRNAVAGQPAHKWPRILGRLWIDRGSHP